MKVVDLTMISMLLRKKLVRAGIVELSDLAVLHKQPQRCFELSHETGVPLKRIRWMVSVALFYQIKGVGLNHSALLVKIGIDSIEKLANSSAEELLINMAESNIASPVIQLMPSLLAVELWIKDAQCILDGERLNSIA
ncbi:MAG: DUF4332 domain-containing protein [Agarilytica sp.]